MPPAEPRPCLVTLLLERTVPSEEETTDTPALFRLCEPLRTVEEELALLAEEPLRTDEEELEVLPLRTEEEEELLPLLTEEELEELLLPLLLTEDEELEELLPLFLTEEEEEELEPPL